MATISCIYEVLPLESSKIEHDEDDQFVITTWVESSTVIELNLKYSAVHFTPTEALERDVSISALSQ